MDRQQLPSYGRSLQPLLNQQQHTSIYPSGGTSVPGVAGKGSGHFADRVTTSKENNTEGTSGVKAEYLKDKLPERGILRKTTGAPGLQTLQTKFSSLIDDHNNFNAQKPSSRRDSLIGRGGIPAPLQPLPQQASVSFQAAAPGPRPGEAATLSWRTAQVESQQQQQQKAGVLPQEAGGGSNDDDIGLDALTSEECRVVRLPASSLANTKVAKAAHKVLEEEAFLKQIRDGLTMELTRTKAGATPDTRIKELAAMVRYLRKCIKEFGARASSLVDILAEAEREHDQQILNVKLAYEASLAEMKAQLASSQSRLAAVEREMKEEKAQSGWKVQAQKDEASRLLRELERLTEERNRAREDATRSEQQRQQLELELKELRRSTSQQQREITVSQSETMRALTEEKLLLESRLSSLTDDFTKQSTTLNSLQDCLNAFEQENGVLRLANDNLQRSLSSKESLMALFQSQIAELKGANERERSQLADLADREEQLRAALERSSKECAALEAFVEEQSAGLDSGRDRLKALERTLAQERSAWEESLRQMQASLSAMDAQRTSLSSEIAEVRAALSTATAQKESAERQLSDLSVEMAMLKGKAENLSHQVVFADSRTAQMEQAAAALRRQVEEAHAELETSRALAAEKGARLEQLEGEFAALQEVLGNTITEEGESGKQIVTRLLTKIASLQQAAVNAEAVRRKLHNDLVDMRGNIRVYCRVKPHDSPITRLGPDGTSITLTVEGKEHRFTYDRVFGPDSTQDAVFAAVSELVQSALDGFHVCIFSYGQTGAGKTHTMQGGDTPASRGIIPRALEKILATAGKLEKEVEWQYTMEASFIEVYNQQLRDLLQEGALLHNDAIKHDIEGGHTAVAGAVAAKITNMQRAAELVRQAGKARAVVATAMNAASSRSHCVFMLKITGEHAGTGTKLLGSICLVDLAGSERLDRSLAQGVVQKETCAINQSLSALGDVFQALSSKSTHVPYRNQKLTYLLQPCLGGSGKTLMFVNINPEPASGQESICSLRFAAKVNGCETGAKGGPKRNVQTICGGEAEAGGSSDPAGSLRGSLSGLPKWPATAAGGASAVVPRRMSMAPQRPGSAKPTTGPSAGVKRPATTMNDIAAKRSKP